MYDLLTEELPTQQQQIMLETTVSEFDQAYGCRQNLDFFRRMWAQCFEPYYYTDCQIEYPSYLFLYTLSFDSELSVDVVD